MIFVSKPPRFPRENSLTWPPMLPYKQTSQKVQHPKWPPSLVKRLFCWTSSHDQLKRELFGPFKGIPWGWKLTNVDFCYFAYQNKSNKNTPRGEWLGDAKWITICCLFKKQSLGPQPKVLKGAKKHDRNLKAAKLRGLTYCVVDFPKAMSIPDREGFACLSKNMSLKWSRRSWHAFGIAFVDVFWLSQWVLMIQTSNYIQYSNSFKKTGRMFSTKYLSW